jgi:oligopeptide/dipeptide ABC transporter ATP-binding protein
VDLLKVEDLVKTFPAPRSRGRVWAVNGVSFALGEGETLGLVGESGSGKTTVGRCILGLTRPSSGSVWFEGRPLSDFRGKQRALRAKVQIVFQEPYDALDPRRPVGEAVKEPLRLFSHLSEARRVNRVVEVATSLGIRADDLSRFPHELSAGLLQRIGIARAMVTEPRLIILDEPTSLLDASARADIIELLMDLQRSSGVAYLFISHDLTTVQHMSHTVAVMYLGQIVEQGSAAQVFSDPMHPYSRSLLSAVLSPDPGSERSPYVLKGEIPSPINLPTGCFLASRCPIAIEECVSLAPELVDTGDGHRVSCIRVAPSERDRMALVAARGASKPEHTFPGSGS